MKNKMFDFRLYLQGLNRLRVIGLALAILCITVSMLVPTIDILNGPRYGRTDYVYLDGDEVVDDKTPEGMKIASDDSIEYRLYVPKSWICKSDSGKSEAYYPESARSNVTLTSYSPNEDTTLDDYVAHRKDEYSKALSGYALVEENDVTMAGRTAKSLVFTSTYEGVTYKQRQVIVLYGEMFYTLTYTATAENYDLHTEDVEQMISAFTFR